MRMFDPEAKVISETRWARTYELPSAGPVYASKFLTDDITISLDTLANEWESWSDRERLEFAKAFKFKPHLSAEDIRILSFLMAKGDERTLVSIASLLPKHPK